VAAENGHVDVARLLLEHGAFPNPVVGRCTLLRHASRCDDIQLLIDHGADVDCTDDADRTPLHLASANGCVRAMQKLLLYGADVNKHMRHGWAPLHRASTHGSPEGILNPVVWLASSYMSYCNSHNEGLNVMIR